MSSIASQTEVPQPVSQFSTARPSFFGIVGGELFKIRRMRILWVLFYLLLAIISIPSIVIFTLNNSNNLAKSVDSVYQLVALELGIVRVFIGFFLLFLTANVFGREYQLGTIRVLLARGVGRLQLLFGKLLAVVIMAIIVLLLCLLVETIWLGAILAIKVGSFDILNQLDNAFWIDLGTYGLTVLTSMGLTILVSIALTSLTRSLAGGLSLSLAWFPADNILPALLQLGYLLTKNALWVNVTQYFLGPNLNYLPAALSERNTASLIGTPPMAVIETHGQSMMGPTTLDSTQVWLVIAAYAVVFLAVSLFLTAKRDVKE